MILWSNSAITVLIINFTTILLIIISAIQNTPFFEQVKRFLVVGSLSQTFMLCNVEFKSSWITISF